MRAVVFHHRGHQYEAWVSGFPVIIFRITEDSQELVWRKGTKLTTRTFALFKKATSSMGKLLDEELRQMERDWKEEHGA